MPHHSAVLLCVWELLDLCKHPTLENSLEQQANGDLRWRTHSTYPKCTVQVLGHQQPLLWPCFAVSLEPPSPYLQFKVSHKPCLQVIVMILILEKVYERLELVGRLPFSVSLS